MNPSKLLLLMVWFATPAAAQVAWTPETQVKVKAIGAVRVSPDGKRVVYTVREPVMTPDRSEFVTQIWVADINGSNQRQLTSGARSATEPKWSPDGSAIAFIANPKGNRNNLHLLRLDGSEPEAITDLASSVASFRWSPDGRHIAFTMTDPKTELEEKNDKGRNDARWIGENPKMQRLYVLRMENDAAGKREIRQLTTTRHSVLGRYDWAPDGRTIAFTRVRSLDDWTTADLATIDVTTGKVTVIADTPAAEAFPLYSPDGTLIAAYVTEVPPRWNGDGRINTYPAAGGSPKAVSPPLEVQVDIDSWSKDGKRIFLIRDEGTVKRIHALDVATGAMSAINDGDDVLLDVELNASGDYFGFVRQGKEAPPEAFISPVDKFAPVRISRANAAFSGMPVGRTEVIRWKSKDGQEVEGLLTYPVGYEPGRKVPLILFIHGGPVGAFLRVHDGMPTFGTYPVAGLVERGYAILRPNPRGSTGYGNEFRKAINDNWSIVDYQDVMAGVDKVVAMGVADEDRLGVMGSSYGGYLTAWIITRTRRFKAASIRAPMTNAMSNVAMTDLPRSIADHFGGEHWDVPENYAKRSPIFHVKNVATPTLIQHGEADARVPIGQSYEFHYALKTRGVPTRFMVFPRQPHAPVEPKMQVAAMQANIEWFDKYIGTASATRR